jgi:bifunctional DNA-binding transcriptional regulator/antitoxin component of YhaV-PrlF toxin-antitoxin module
MYEVLLYLFGSGISLFAILITWGNKIKGPRKDLRDLEKEFCTKFDIKDEDILPIIKRGENGEREGIFKGITSLSKIFISKKLKKKEDVYLLKKIKSANEKIEVLKGAYSSRYSSVIILTILFFLCGFILLNLPSEGKLSTNFIEINYDILLSLPPSLFIIYLSFEVSKTKRKEDELGNLMEEILDRV